MTTEHAEQNRTPYAELAAQIEDWLGALGGQSAFAARRVASGPARVLPMHASANHDDHDDHDEHSHTPAAEHDISLHGGDAFPAASLAKLPIAVELMRRADLGQFDLAERLDTSTEPRAGGGGVLDAFDPATQLTLAELCYLMLGVSDNTAANALLDLVGMGEVNETLSRLGFTRTRLARRFMDLEARAARRDNLTCADDLVTLFALLRSGALPGARRLRGMLAAQLVADDIRAWLPVGAELSHKTGELDDVFGDAGILAGPTGSCAFCVLTAEQPSLPAARFTAGRVVRLLWDAWCAGTV